MSNLFQLGDFTLHSGKRSEFKIECDALTDEDWEALASRINFRFKFCKVIGVPTGGLKLAIALQKFCIKNYKNILIVDDVLSTGISMEEIKMNLFMEPYPKELFNCRVTGVVVFARGKCPSWIQPIFQMW